MQARDDVRSIITEAMRAYTSPRYRRPMTASQLAIYKQRSKRMRFATQKSLAGAKSSVKSLDQAPLRVGKNFAIRDPATGVVKFVNRRGEILGVEQFKRRMSSAQMLAATKGALSGRTVAPGVQLSSMDIQANILVENLLTARALAAGPQPIVRVIKSGFVGASGVRNDIKQIWRGETGQVIGDDGNNLTLMLNVTGRIQVPKKEFGNYFELRDPSDISFKTD